MNDQIPTLLFSTIAHSSKKQYQNLYQGYPVFKTKSQDIHIVIYPSWLEEYSYPRKNMYSWTYHVRIENHNTYPIYILQKNWDIIKANSQVSTIQTTLLANDVVKLNSGEACDYTTCITLNTPSNIIKGHYRISDDTGRIFNIDIPSFNLDNPHDFCSIN